MMSALWPEAIQPLSAPELSARLKRLQAPFAELLIQQQLPELLNAELSRLYLPLAAWLNQQRPAEGPLVIGINGAQGSGKSTLCNLLQWLLETAFNCRSVVLSIDDLYLPKTARRQLAEQVHPLLATRGVPGTHDTALGLDLLEKLRTRQPITSIAIPRFDKAQDDRLPRQQWEQLTAPVDLILFEGWCVGATPQAEANLIRPLNQLETREDADGRWRCYVNRQLAGPYHQLFAQLDLLLMLKVPDWDRVYHWRTRQEKQLAARGHGEGIMDDRALRHFIQHYERLTRHQLATLPQTADLVLELNREQRVTGLKLPAT